MNRARNRTGWADPLMRTLRLTRLAMVLERFLRAFWPLGSLIAVVWAVLAFGLGDLASRLQVLAMLGVAAALALVLLVTGIRGFRWPSLRAARDRLDAVLPGRPLEALGDRPALGARDPQAEFVWSAHQARMRRAAAAARVARPDLRLASHDPWGLRLMALVMLFAALVFARSSPVDSLSTALAPTASATVASGPSYEGWAEPPAYTGRPTLYLPELPGTRPVPVPVGTIITLRAYGATDRFALEESVSRTSGTALVEAAPGIGSAELTLSRSGSVTLRENGETLGEWSFTMEPDAAPTIDLAEPVSRAVTGEMELDYTARDDYGVTGARAEIALDLAAVDRRHGLAVAPENRPPLTVDLPLPMSGAATEVAERMVEDFSKHPWVGLPVTITLTAQDALGQSGRREGLTATLPGRRFYDPLAAAVIEQRRDLLWAAENARRVTQVLRAVTHRPEAVFDSPSAYLVIRTAIRRLAAAVTVGGVGAVREEVAEALWQGALLLEDGSLGDAAERLARAKERLAEALRGDATDEEIAQLMDELREATRDYMEQMAREALERGEQQRAEAPPPDQTMTQDQIQELMDRIQELSEQGRRAEAEALLEMLQQMLENMEMMLTEGQQGGGGQGQQSLQGLSDTLREQQGLADDSFQQLQREFREGRLGNQGQSGDGQPRGEGGATEGTESLAERQEALRELLDGLREQMPGEAGEAAREALREAERSMGAARDELRDGDTAGALDEQSEAIDNLREGIQEMAEDLRRAQEGGDGQQAQQEGQSQSDGSRDPLGRQIGSRGALGTDRSMLPGADAGARARKLLDEIRRRSGDRTRPEIELDYLRRLLDRF